MEWKVHGPGMAKKAAVYGISLDRTTHLAFR